MERSAASPIRRVLVVGAGTMGRGIASLCALRGVTTFLFDADPDALGRAHHAIDESWEKSVRKGRLDAEGLAAARHRLHGLDRLIEGSSAELVIEAIPEDLDLKRMLFAELDAVCGKGTIFATNTSSLSITKIGEATGRADRVVGLHFFNPAPAMPLVEIVVGRRTSDATRDLAREFAEALGKSPIVVEDSPGFATSRLGLALGLEAMRMAEEGIATPSDIDQAMEKGYGHSLGPLKTSDLVGLDVRLSIAETLSRELSIDRFRPPEILRLLVAEGKLGKKSGRGFYLWTEKGPVPAELPEARRRTPHSRGTR
jgi:3-hydroxybutyryl-CoA dehydrogenase